VLVVLVLVVIVVLIVTVAVLPFILVLVGLSTRFAWTQLAVLENPEQRAAVTIHNKSGSCSGSGKILSGKFCHIL